MKLFCLISLALVIILTSCTEKKIEDSQYHNNVLSDTTTYLFYGYVSTIDKTDDYYSISVDTIQYYIGEEAKEQFESDGDPDAEFNDMFYIRNTKEEYVDFKLADNVEIITQTLSHDEEGNFQFNKKTTLDDFISFVKTDTLGILNYIPFELLIKNNRVIKIKEIYIP